MASAALKDRELYVIQRIKNPGCYLIAQHDHGKYFKEKIKQFERLLANDVEKCQSSEEIHIGQVSRKFVFTTGGDAILNQVVAIKDDKSFHTARVNDIFKRSSKTVFWILLIDTGKIIETHASRIYIIKNQILKDKMSNAVEILLHGIQPAAIDINYNNPIPGGIFHFRKSNEWSSSAYKFVRKLFFDNPLVYVKIINHNKISGEIYYVDESSREHVSLAQKLCDEGYAVFCDTETSSESGESCREIQEKIPKNVLSSDPESSSTSSKSSGNKTEQSVCLLKDNSSSLSENTVIEVRKFDSVTSLGSNKEEMTASSYSKKLLNYGDDKLGNKPTEPLKLNVCRILSRNMWLLNKKNTIGRHNQN